MSSVIDLVVHDKTSVVHHYCGIRLVPFTLLITTMFFFICYLLKSQSFVLCRGLIQKHVTKSEASVYWVLGVMGKLIINQ